ncbi:indolepyruvate oxidoreductase subunit beta family protein [Pacificibacter marinus]|uniref:Putative indolepyruvate oxidoreductase subunit B n=1 Tax=Pacificibacter marinus TaxID=658057 RepID=A0A1Y5TFG7_9RHOB|nr:indolepyruvate oxidoreductase subunit beta family protein [Pacificibacter marinus]SEL09651.1 indolepyruvate ferredoxin oxidoreductase beta subunit [Pacificibacter marinus]SLN59145.1 putative indolepyruvate oxidoreductase subunit B [Pacificibacter marinus]
MNIQTKPLVARRSPGPDGEKIITLAALAVGGQGGGVLTNWIVAVAEANGYRAQSTSVAGVAQRTGATIYYIEMCRDTGRMPVFSLSPSIGDVDILMASELMEGGRAIMRGFVTPGRTTLITSTHRIAAVSEKIVPGDGRFDETDVYEAMGIAADQLVAFDMETVAKKAGSVISSSLLGALAGSGALPFERSSFEDIIRASGRGVDASLRAFGDAYDIAKGDKPAPQPQTAADLPVPVLNVPKHLKASWSALEKRIIALPLEVQEMTGLGIKKVVDYQDVTYGHQYLDMVEKSVTLDTAPYEMSANAAKYCARALCYDDLLRVADIKTRASRFARVKDEVVVKDDQVLHLTEYFHPRYEEFTTTLPRALGQFMQKRKGVEAFYTKHFDKGRRIRTDSLSGYLSLWLVSSLRPIRRKLLRHDSEMTHANAWFDTAMDVAKTDTALASEVLANYRLIKGYSDTHVRGMSKFARIMQSIDLLKGRPDAADWMRRLRTAALDDVEGDKLDGALETIKSFAG